MLSKVSRIDSGISIHALLAESDSHRTVNIQRPTAFSIHALLAESDGQCFAHYIANNFSIHALLAESDLFFFILLRLNLFFYPRSPCGERLCRLVVMSGFICFFYPRSPCGERPDFKFLGTFGNAFSIHALLAESD